MAENMEIEYRIPFPITAVANFYNSLQNTIIVETKAIKDTKKIVDNWISQKSDGITIAVQGEYGTGKTQLAIEVQRYIKNYGEDQYHFIGLDSPSASFLEMYRNRFLNELTKNQVLERLEACYYEIILRDMEQDELYQAFLQRKRTLKSVDLIERFGLSKSKYDFAFEKKLNEVTKNVNFVPALLLLLEPRFEEEVWNWFNGGEPSAAMKERGVKFKIDNDISALESIGVFAFLFGQQGHTFVLFIDEMEKIVSSTEKVKKESFEALKKLIETVKATRSMLILCGLPDYYMALPKDVQQRIAYQIKTEEITLTEIKSYIIKANEKVNGVKTIIPFSDKNIKDILEISSGNIRTIIRLLYHSGNWYIENQSPIDEKALCIILENAYGNSNLKGIHKGLAQLFISKGWLFEENKEYKGIVIDFWLPSVLTHKDISEYGIEIYLVQNILSEEDYKEISNRMRVKTNNCKICVVEGFINDRFYKRLSNSNKHVFKYRMPEFKKIFLSFIDGEKAKYENSIKQYDFNLINEKIEKLSIIVNKAINEINENVIGKHEFYYIMRHFLDIDRENFYLIPDKESDFYLLISEINKTIDVIKKGRREQGALFFLRELSYIIYYLSEKPDKLQIAIRSDTPIYKICGTVLELSDQISKNCGIKFRDRIDKYHFVLSYLEYSYRDKKKAIYQYKENGNNYLLLSTDYNDDFFAASNAIKQISQNFCAELLLEKPEIVINYDEIFVQFYYFLYVIEPAIMQREIVEADWDILREYYDLIRRYSITQNNDNMMSILPYVFEKYDSGLRRIAYGRDY